jgi:hypothetical protein
VDNQESVNGIEVLMVVSGVRRRRETGEHDKADRRCIADTTTGTKPPYFGRTIALKKGLVFRVRGGLAHAAERTVALRKDVTAESPALQSS